MNTLGRVWSFTLGYRRVVVASLCLLLLISGLVNYWQYGMIRQSTALALAETKVGKDKVDQLQGQLKLMYAKEAAKKRVDQLYKEIDNLNQLSDHIFTEGQLSRKAYSTR